MSGRTSPQLAAALRYAAHGWPVFPTVPDAGTCPDPDNCLCKAPVTTHGLLDATTDEDEVRRLWQREPRANVAIACGRPGPDVLDIDRKGDRSGFPALQKAQRAGLIGQPQGQIVTPREGWHLYFAGTDQRSSATKALVDFRSAGGYVVAPPSSVHGRPYAVVHKQVSADTVDWAAIREVVDPQPERSVWTPRGDRPTELRHLPGWVASIPQGQGLRNQLNFWAMCRAAEAGDPAVMDEICRAAISNGKPEREVMASRRSAERTAIPQAEPRPFARPPQRQLEAG